MSNVFRKRLLKLKRCWKKLKKVTEIKKYIEKLNIKWICSLLKIMILSKTRFYKLPCKKVLWIRWLIRWLRKLGLNANTLIFMRNCVISCRINPALSKIKRTCLNRVYCKRFKILLKEMWMSWYLLKPMLKIMMKWQKKNKRNMIVWRNKRS